MRQAVSAVIDTFDLVEHMHVQKCKLDMLERTASSAWGVFSKFTPQQVRMRFPIAMGGYLSDGWNKMDLVRRLPFRGRHGLRIACLPRRCFVCCSPRAQRPWPRHTSNGHGQDDNRPFVSRVSYHAWRP